MRKLATMPCTSITTNLKTADLIVTGMRNAFDKCNIGVVPAGREGRKEYMGPMVPGPWAYEVTHGMCIDSSGLSKRQRDACERTTSVKMHNSGGGMIEIDTPYHPEFVATLKNACPWKCRRWDAERKTWHVLMTETVRKALWASMRKCWPGSAGMAPNGELFEIAPIRPTVAA